MSKTKAHQKYKTRDGRIVPGVTTVIGNNLGWNKNVLIAWSRREALKGNDPELVKQAAANIGTCAHYMCECDAKGLEPDLSDFSPNTIKVAENCFLGYLEWKKTNNISKIQSEIPLVSERYLYGGTIDMLYESEGRLILGDIKTSSSIWTVKL